LIFIAFSSLAQALLNRVNYLGKKYDETYAHAVQTTACSALAALSASCFWRPLPPRDTFEREMGC
jgi:hypothetical protein